jgi:hypothetical protein
VGNNEQQEHVVDDEGSNKEGKGGKRDGERGWRETKRARAARAMASVMRVSCNDDNNWDSNKSNGDEGGGQAMATRAMAAAMGMGIATTMTTI